MTAEEKYKIALNIVARVGVEGNVMGEFAKAMAGINSMSSQEQMANMQKMAQNTPITPNQPIEGTIPPEAGQGMPQDPNALNQSPQPIEAGKYDNV